MLVLLGMVAGYPLYCAFSRDVYRARSYDVITKESLGTSDGVKTTFTVKYSPVASGSETVYLVKSKESLGTGDGIETTFTLEHFPVASGSERVYLAGVATTDYSINYETGEITFDTAPEIGVAINVDYNIGVATTAYSINYETGEITFDTAPVAAVKIKADYLGWEGTIYTLYFHTSGIYQIKKKTTKLLLMEMSGYWNQQGNEITITLTEIVGTGHGVTTFTLDYPPVVSGSETVYLDGVATTAYSINYETGEITFDTAPALGMKITADYQIYSTIDGNNLSGLGKTWVGQPFWWKFFFH